MGLITVSEKVKSYLRALIPVLSLKINGFEFTINLRKIWRGRLNEGVLNEGVETIYFRLQLMDIDLLSFSRVDIEPKSTSKSSDSPAGTPRRTVAILGVKYQIKPYITGYNAGTSTISDRGFSQQKNDKLVQLDLRLVSVLVAMMMIYTIHYFAPSAVFVTSIMPILHTPLSQLSAVGWLTSYRAFIAWQQVQLVIGEWIYLAAGGRLYEPSYDSVRSYLLPLFHYRTVIYFAIIAPAVLLQYQVMMFLVIGSALISVLDVVFQYQDVFKLSLFSVFNFNFAGLNILPDSRKEDYQPSRDIVTFKLLSFSLLKSKTTLRDKISKANDQMNPSYDKTLYKTDVI